MLEAIERLQACRMKYSLDVASSDYMIFDVILMEFENLANHAMKLTRDLLDNHPELYLNELKAIRHRIAHDYLSVQLEILYDTIDNDLNPLKENLIKLIK